MCGTVMAWSYSKGKRLNKLLPCALGARQGLTSASLSVPSLELPDPLELPVSLELPEAFELPEPLELSSLSVPRLLCLARGAVCLGALTGKFSWADLHGKDTSQAGGGAAP